MGDATLAAAMNASPVRDLERIASLEETAFELERKANRFLFEAQDHRYQAEAIRDRYRESRGRAWFRGEHRSGRGGRRPLHGPPLGGWLEVASVYEMVRDRIISSLSSGTVPWRQTWQGLSPCNVLTGRPYQGINRILLAGHPWWGTYKQVKQLGGYVRKGEKASGNP